MIVDEYPPSPTPEMMDLAQQRAEVEKIARSIAFWHGQKVVGRQDGQTVTIASRHGYGLWGHSPSLYADKHWHEYTAAAGAELERTQARIEALRKATP